MERLALAEPVEANASRETVNMGNNVQHLVDRSLRIGMGVRGAARSGASV